jgi:hypothetical protein
MLRMVSLKKHYTKKSLSRGHHLPLSSTPYQLSVTFSHTFLNRFAKYFFPTPRFLVTDSVADPGCLSRIPDPTFSHPGSRIRTVSIPDPNCLHPGSGILIKEFKYFNPKKAKKWFLSSKKYDPGCSFRISDPDADFLPSRIPDPGVKKAPNPGSRIPDPGSGSATLVTEQ